MNRELKIKLLQAIKAGKLPVEVLTVETGIYKHVSNGIYENAGTEISYSDLMATIQERPDLMATIIYFENKEAPYSIWVSAAMEKRKKIDVINWIEEKTFAPHEIKVVDESSADTLNELFTDLNK